MASTEYVIRFATMSLVAVELNGNKSQIKTALAEGLGEYRGRQMVLVGENSMTVKSHL